MTSTTKSGFIPDQPALVLFSGGQDSATILAWALERFGHVETVGFTYGQRHMVEMACRQEIRTAYAGVNACWADRLGRDHLVDLTALGAISETAMTRQIDIVAREDGLPSTFVPGRNLMFLVMAAALAWRRGISTLVAGMCETDFSGYPDCRQDTLDAQMRAIILGMQMDLELDTPLMRLTKAQTWQMAEQIGGDKLISIIREKSHTCYLGERGYLHDWGYGCGTCPACELRTKGWNDYQQAASLS